MKYADSILDLIGHTPLVRLNKVTEGIGATVLAKLEYLNPGGSVKDRIAMEMIDDAEKSGQLLPGGTIVEPTSGNTGVGLALVAQSRGYETVFVTPDKVGIEKRDTLRAYGARIALTSTAVAPESEESYYGVSDALVKNIPGAYKPDQFNNPAAPRAHYASTGPEIWEDTAGKITHFVAGAGTGGTITGTGRYLKDVSAQEPAGPVKIIAADPEGSVYSGGSGRPYFVEGVGEDMWPENYDPSVPDQVIAVNDAEAFEMTRRLAREEGLLVGGSSGMAVVAALNVARDLPEDAVVVVLLPDSGRGYLGKIFSDQWMSSRGFEIERAEDLPQVPGLLPETAEELDRTSSSKEPLNQKTAEPEWLDLPSVYQRVSAATRVLAPTLNVQDALEQLGEGESRAVIAPESLPFPLGEAKAIVTRSALAKALAHGNISLRTQLSELAEIPGFSARGSVGVAEEFSSLLRCLDKQKAAPLAQDGQVIGVILLEDLLP